MLKKVLMGFSRQHRKKTVMVVCMENLCRSPLAAELLNAMLKHHGMQMHFKAESAGISVGIPGRKPDPRVLKLMQVRGLALPKGRSRQLDAKLASKSDFILAVDRQVQQLLQERLGVKSQLLMEFATLAVRHQTLDVPDPYFTNQQGFERVYELVEEASLGVVEHLKQVEVAHSNS